MKLVYGNSDIFFHYVKSVRIRSFSGPYFPAFGVKMVRYSVSLRIQYKREKMRTRKTSNTDTFHVVNNSRTVAFPLEIFFYYFSYK